MAPGRRRVENLLMKLFYGPKYRLLSDDNVSKIEPGTETLFTFRLLALVTLGLPLFGFSFCIIWSILYNFQDATSTHCGVDNWLPSVSASIGAFSPQKYVWRLTVGVHAAPRFFVSFLYFLLFHNSRILLIFNFIEIASLVGLSMVSSTENFGMFLFVFLS